MNMQNLSFVRQDMVAASPRPSGRGGTLEWTRKNLFNSWLSTLLTVGSVLTVAWLIVAVAPWLGNSVWRANSLVECRQVLGDAPGACWGVIRDRWPQLLFGFYPAHLYWRPVLAFALLFAALAPVLLRALPRRALWFSIVYPGIAYFLIWGGSLWFPISVYFGFAVGAGLFMLAARAGKGPSVGIAVIGASVWWVYAAQPISSLADGMAPIALDSIASRDVGGFLLSIIIGVTGIAMSLPLGILLALGRRSNLPSSIC
ncbi:MULTISPECIES: hypothetical protein [Rhizobium]|uniref:General L-amino acid transport system permease protein n=3 Tax=Rhizobium TaxID=379 RepID=A0A1C3XAN7_9HYPH|nr:MULTISPECIES: hypothetical protein [Rhizobium]ENN88312.1 hypothetical protein RHSP_00694 [Rhizobium freirei PRF 81]MBB4244808.1 general L-amino acid transport system permease protein [Rhizobium tropici]MBB5596195.1 general L-amino acid transport system permease protein [Rhizobium tropici]MBB6488173.1 general L-amino acid transport system permease protein [Rhizobium lusitanum]MBB6495228.1 general L-amino acid transport system permease protein [Rhizobium tropici]